MRFACCFVVVCLASGCSSEEPREEETSPVAANSEPVVDDATPDREGEAASEPIQGETILDRIQGAWEIVDANMSGASVAAMKGGIATIDGDKIVVEISGSKTESTMKFDHTTDPVQFESANAGGKLLAILKLAGDEIIVATGMNPIAGHPKSFNPGPGVMVIKYKKK